MSEENKSFWATLPGIITAVAGILGSIAAILALISPPPSAIPAPQIEEFISIPAEIDSDQIATLKWKISATSDAEAAIDQGIGEVVLSGTKQVSPPKTTTYTLTVTNKEGKEDIQTATVYVSRQKDPVLQVDAVPTIVVDQMGRGNYNTISEAISEAAEGSRILIKKGVYDEGFKIDKPLEIVGDGSLGDVVIRAVGEDAILFKSIRGKVSNLMLRQNGDGSWYGVDIAQGSLELVDCDISSDSLSCVAIHGNAFARIIRNKIHDGNQSGIYVYENGEGVIEDNDIFDNAHAGIEIKDGGNPTLRKNRINNNGFNGIWIYDSAGGTFEDNDLKDNKIGAWDISDDSKSKIISSGNIE